MGHPSIWGRKTGKGNRGKLEGARPSVGLQGASPGRPVSGEGQRCCSIPAPQHPEGRPRLCPSTCGNAGDPQAHPQGLEVLLLCQEAGERLRSQVGRMYWGNSLPVIHGQVNPGCPLAMLSKQSPTFPQTQDHLPCSPSGTHLYKESPHPPQWFWKNFALSCTFGHMCSQTYLTGF